MRESNNNKAYNKIIYALLEDGNMSISDLIHNSNSHGLGRTAPKTIKSITLECIADKLISCVDISRQNRHGVEIDSELKLTRKGMNFAKKNPIRRKPMTTYVDTYLYEKIQKEIKESSNKLTESDIIYKSLRTKYKIDVGL